MDTKAGGRSRAVGVALRHACANAQSGTAAKRASRRRAYITDSVAIPGPGHLVQPAGAATSDAERSSVCGGKREVDRSVQPA